MLIKLWWTDTHGLGAKPPHVLVLKSKANAVTLLKRCGKLFALRTRVLVFGANSIYRYGNVYVFKVERKFEPQRYFELNMMFIV